MHDYDHDFTIKMLICLTGHISDCEDYCEFFISMEGTFLIK